jgi:DNA-directed RNA polymerase subunit beta'
MVRQMFSRVVIKDSGDTDFIVDEIVERPKFMAVNRAMRAKKKQPAKAVVRVMGITRVSLTSDSFLSAASFQETSRVLVNAAVQRKIDNLNGLKENVIIGKLVPAGTGIRGFDEGFVKRVYEVPVPPEEAAGEPAKVDVPAN